MNCPKCSYPNPPGTTYCLMCYETLMHSASRQFLESVRREQRAKAARTVSAASTPSLVFALDCWLRRLKNSPATRPVAGAAILAALIGLIYPFLPSRALRLGNCHLAHLFPPRARMKFLVGTTVEVKSWSERDGQLDTPLPLLNETETGSVSLEAATPAASSQLVRVVAREWIKTTQTPDGTTSEQVPRQDPSLKSGEVLLGGNGEVIDRRGQSSTRMGRSLIFLLPHWPDGEQRVGSRWDEPVEWMESLGDWTVCWNGIFHWRVTGAVRCAQAICVALKYQADLTPALRGMPDWARGAVSTVHFAGSGDGEALFNTAKNSFFSNTFIYQGALTLPITDLGHIPLEERIGRPVDGEPGDILLQIQDRLDLRKLSAASDSPSPS